ncbi:8762_t:CDS:1, partial [Cetraspora pellucida]
MEIQIRIDVWKSSPQVYYKCEFHSTFQSHLPMILTKLHSQNTYGQFRGGACMG